MFRILVEFVRLGLCRRGVCYLYRFMESCYAQHCQHSLFFFCLSYRSSDLTAGHDVVLVLSLYSHMFMSTEFQFLVP